LLPTLLNILYRTLRVVDIDKVKAWIMVKLCVMCTWFITVQKYGLLCEEVIIFKWLEMQVWT